MHCFHLWSQTTMPQTTIPPHNAGVVVRGLYWPYGTPPPPPTSHVSVPLTYGGSRLVIRRDGFLADCAKVGLGLWVLGSSRDYLRRNVSRGVHVICDIAGVMSICFRICVSSALSDTRSHI